MSCSIVMMHKGIWTAHTVSPHGSLPVVPLVSLLPSLYTLNSPHKPGISASTEVQHCHRKFLQVLIQVTKVGRRDTNNEGRRDSTAHAGFLNTQSYNILLSLFLYISFFIYFL